VDRGDARLLPWEQVRDEVKGILSGAELADPLSRCARETSFAPPPSGTKRNGKGWEKSFFLRSGTSSSGRPAVTFRA